MKRARFEVKIIFIVIVFLVPLNSMASSQLTSLYKESKGSVVSVNAIDRKGNIISSGSGFYIENGKKIVTNYHVIEDASSIVIVDADGHEIDIRQVSYISNKSDIVIISLHQAGDPLKISKILPSVGEEVVTIGNPRGLENTLSTGIVSGIRNADNITLIQTTTPISPGSSGGPLLNTSGEVIGITTFYLEESQNVNFAISVIELERLYMSSRYTSIIDGKTKTVDYSSPLSVAEAFFSAWSEGNVDKATSYVHAEDQKYIEREFQKGTLDIPKNTPLEINYRGWTKNDLPAADVGFLGTKIGADLVIQFNRWWIAK